MASPAEQDPTQISTYGTPASWADTGEDYLVTGEDYLVEYSPDALAYHQPAALASQEGLQPPFTSRLPTRNEANKSSFQSGSDTEPDLYRNISPRPTEHPPPMPKRRSQSRRRPSSAIYDEGNYRTEVAVAKAISGARSSRRPSYYNSEISSSFEDKVNQAAQYQDEIVQEIAGPGMQLTAERLRKAAGHGSSSTKSWGSRNESVFTQSATTRTTLSSVLGGEESAPWAITRPRERRRRGSSNAGGEEDMTIRVKGNAILNVGGAKMRCQDGTEINIMRRPSPPAGYPTSKDSYLGQEDRRSRMERPSTRTRAISQAASFSRSTPEYQDKYSSPFEYYPPTPSRDGLASRYGLLSHYEVPPPYPAYPSVFPSQPLELDSFLGKGINTAPSESQKTPELAIATYNSSKNSPPSNSQIAAHERESHWATAPPLGLGSAYIRPAELSSIPSEPVLESAERIGGRAGELIDQVSSLLGQSHDPVGLLSVEHDLEMLNLTDSGISSPERKLKGLEACNPDGYNESLEETIKPVRGTRSSHRNPVIFQDLREQVETGMARAGEATQLEIKAASHNQSVVADSSTYDPPGEATGTVGSGQETDESWCSDSGTGSESVTSEDRVVTVVDSSARVLRILQRNKARVVRQIVQYCRNLIVSRDPDVQELRDEGGGVQGDGSSSKHAPNCSQIGGDGSKRTFSNLKGDGHQEDEDSRGGGNDKRRPVKRPRMSGQETVAEGLKLACPYFKRNPLGPRIGQSCGGPGWLTIHRLKEHLYRRHSCVRCLRCGTSFRTESDLIPHSQTETACTVNSTIRDPDDGFEKQQETLLRRRWKAPITTEEQWRQAYKILFPDDREDLIPSPYYQDHRTMVDEFARFELFLRRETTRLLEERLNQSLLDGYSRLDPASLGGQLSNVVNEIQAQAIGSYRNTSQGSDGAQSGDGEGSHGNSDHPASIPSPYVNISEILAGATELQMPNNTGRSSDQQTFDWMGGEDNLLDMANFEDTENWYDVLLHGDTNFGDVGGEQQNLGLLNP